jgi:hypothetical protein
MSVLHVGPGRRPGGWDSIVRWGGGWDPIVRWGETHVSDRDGGV